MSAEIFNFNQIYDFETCQKFINNHKVQIGIGANGKVYKAWINKALPFAIKIIDLDHDIENRQKEIINLCKETDMLMKINHPHIMKVYFRFLYNNEEKNKKQLYIGMELAPKDLKKLLKEKKKFNEYEISQLATQLHSALSYLETNKIIHRDLKPENILVTEDGTYKLCDFSEFKWQKTPSKNTTLKGSPGYLSPELKSFYLEYKQKIQIEEDVSNQVICDPFKSDVFSFGLILLKCLLGSSDERIEVINSKKDILQYILKNYCTLSLRNFLEKCLAFNPDERLFFNELNQFLQVNTIELIFQLNKKDEEIAILKKNQKFLIEETKKQQLILKEVETIKKNYELQLQKTQKEKDQELETISKNYEILINKTQKQQLILKNQEIQAIKKNYNALVEDTNKKQQVLTNINNQIQKLYLEENQLLKLKIDEMKKWHLIKKSDKKIIEICLKNQKVWKNESQNSRRNQFSKNTNNLKWSNVLDLVSNDAMYMSKFHLFSNAIVDDDESYSFEFWPNYWTDSTGKKDYTYWRGEGFLFMQGEAWSVTEEDISTAIAIVKKLTEETGYEFKDCLRMLHSNLWNYDKSKNDLMY